jgi:hypothetical protein
MRCIICDARLNRGPSTDDLCHTCVHEIRKALSADSLEDLSNPNQAEIINLETYRLLKRGD